MMDILQVTCKEPIGDVTHVIKPMVLTPANLHTFWEKSRPFKTLFTSEIRGDFKKFLEVFLRDGPNGIESNGLFWVIDDFTGVLYMTDIIPGVDAKCHLSFFDRRSKGREELVRHMLRYAFDKYHFKRLTVEIALYANPSFMRFVESIGFVKEGRRRFATLFNEKWYDVNCYGILNEELK
jgi:RimJ/RimL family protein N-acetyltransferase